HDAHARGVEVPVPLGAEAGHDLAERRHQPAEHELVEPLEHLVDALADEGLDALVVHLAALDVAVVELLRAVLEARQARVAVDRRHAAPSPRPGPGPPAKGAADAGAGFAGPGEDDPCRSAGGRARAHHTTAGVASDRREPPGGGKGEVALPSAHPSPSRAPE